MGGDPSIHDDFSASPRSLVVRKPISDQCHRIRDRADLSAGLQTHDGIHYLEVHRARPAETWVQGHYHHRPSWDRSGCVGSPPEGGYAHLPVRRSLSSIQTDRTHVGSAGSVSSISWDRHLVASWKRLRAI